MQGWSCSYDELNIGLGSEKGCGMPAWKLFHIKFFLSSSKIGFRV